MARPLTLDEERADQRDAVAEYSADAFYHKTRADRLEAALREVDDWLLAHGDTTPLLTRVQHLDEFMEFARSEAVARAQALEEERTAFQNTIDGLEFLRDQAVARAEAAELRAERAEATIVRLMDVAARLNIEAEDAAVHPFARAARFSASQDLRQALTTTEKETSK